MIDIEERSRRRRGAMEGNRTRSPAEAEAWDLEFWQRRSPDERLSALVAIFGDVARVEAVKDRPARPGS